MSASERVLEVRGESAEQAVAAGLAELGLSRDEVTIEVLDEGSRGFLGIGGRDALVRLTAGPEAVVSELAPQPLVEPAMAEERKEAVAPAEVEEEEPREEEVALEIVNNLLEKLRIKATTSLRLSEPDDRTGEQRPIIAVEGEDLGLLIGPRGETLNAFEYLARLMTGHVIRRRPYFIVDVEGYRQRRAQALSRLAERMATKAVKGGQIVTLEPMPANERRIIHVALRDHEDVYTESTGEGKKRRVRIFPRR